jgi:RNA polymerase sigma factor (sigma-70 family)
MASKSLNGVLQHVRKVAAIQSARADDDPRLLERFIRSSDEAALTVLIERHAPMVLGVCRRALGCVHDAEDACQATFLVFSRKAATIRKGTALSSWLHAVALRVTANIKRERARRERRERRRHSRISVNPADEVSWAEVQTALDEELQRLPERYRTVLILCYLEGQTRDEAAEKLAVSAGTLHGLLERGRKLLAQRLTKRGVTLSAGLFGVALTGGTATASWPATQVINTAHASSLFALGKPVGETVSATVLNLSNQVLKGMLMTKLKLVTAGALCAAFLVTTVGFTFAQSADGERQKQLYERTVNNYRVLMVGKKDTDEAFIKRVSMDLRGSEPTPAEIHFFVNSKDPSRRETLVDLFIKERDMKKKLATDMQVERAMEFLHRSIQFTDKATEADLKKKAAETNKAPRSEADAKAAIARAELDVFKANVELASSVVLQIQLRLTAAKNASSKEIQASEAELRVAQARLEQARAALSAAEKKLPK